MSETSAATRAIAAIALLTGCLVASPAGPASAGGGGTGLPGPQYGDVASGVDYFLALNAEDEKFDEAGDSDFTSFDANLQDTISGADGNARSSTRIATDVYLGPGGPVSGTTLHGMTSRGFVSGRASAAREEGVPVADGTSSATLAFSVVETPTPYSLTASVNSTNSDDEDCSESSVRLEGETTLFEKVDFAGGDCDSAITPVGGASGVLPVGSYELIGFTTGAVAADYDAANFSGTYFVELKLFPPCTHESDDTGEVITGTGGDDVICAEGGNDEIDARGGNDIILAGEGNDEIDGGGGNDKIIGDRGEDEATGGDGKDLIEGGDGVDDLSGGGGDDFDATATGPVTAGVFGGPGNDTTSGDGGKDFVDGGEGEDRVFGGGGPDALEGAQGEDHVIGGSGNDLMAGGDQGDVMNGGGGADDILAQAGADKAVGAAGDDEMVGGTENDELRGDADEDKVLGGPGADEIVGGEQRDRLEGQDDNDKILAKDGTKDQVLGGPGGNDRAKRDAIDDVSGVEAFI